MSAVAVIAHRKKSLGGGLSELRRLLAGRGIEDPIWYEVQKSRNAPDAAKRAVKDGADRLLLWGGDGTVQRSIDALTGSAVTVGVIPAGTANLLARNLGIPTNLRAAVDIALDGRPRTLDLGVINGERFAVMAGAGFDALTMRKAAKGGLKDRFGPLAYVWTGIRATLAESNETSIRVDDVNWFNAKASCVLLGNMGTLTGGLTAFPDARPDDGLLEVGVVTAHGPIQWATVLAHLLGQTERSKLVWTTRGRRVDIELERPTPYELDGGARRATQRLEARIDPAAITVAVPRRQAQRTRRQPAG